MHSMSILSENVLKIVKHKREFYPAFLVSFKHIGAADGLVFVGQ